MLRPSRIVGVVLAATIALLLVFTALSMAHDRWHEPGQIIVKFAPQVGTIVAEKNDGVVSLDIASLDLRMERYGIHRIDQLFPHKDSQLGLIYQFEFDPKYSVKSVAEDFAADEHLLYAEPRYRHRICDTPNDPNYTNGLQWYLNTVQAPDAWSVSKGDSSLIIGIVDVGVDWNHPDLIDNRWFNSGEDLNGDGVPDVNGIDDDENGFIDDFYGWDFAGIGTGVPDYLPDEGATGHGTHTAGVCAAATDNDLACAGMSWKCTFMPVKVSADGSSDITFGYEGIQYAVDNGAMVINLSWTRGDTASAFEQEIIDSAFAKGAILVAAAGNDEAGSTFAPPDTCPLSYPACYSHVTAVAATDMNDRATSFTYYGTWVDVCAPGNGMFSHLWDDSYGMRSSTSSACALVSGVAALLKFYDPSVDSDEFQTRMRTTSDYIDDLNPDYAGQLGGGRLNAHRAVLNIPHVEETWTTSGTVPNGYALSQNHPNPFNPSTTISYSLPQAGQATLRIYNVGGQLIRILVDSIQSEGEYAVRWDGCDRDGQRVTSGIYFYRLSAGNWSQAKKMVLMR